MVLAAALALAPGPAAGQWISPGELSRVHAALDGDRSCTRCHVLRERGVQGKLCLECHAPLDRRIAAGRGFHAALGGEDCGGCHREHFGRDVMPMRIDTAAFRHEEEVGWPLRGGHGGTACRACHRPALLQDSALAGFDALPGFGGRTFLGLPTLCAACHADDDPHGDQFAGQECGACHDEVDWERPVLFAHDRTRYRLTGGHRDVACEGCHRPDNGVVRYAPLAFDRCESCHADPHGPAMVGACASCHTTAGWSGVAARAVESRFRHAATRFPLVGAHEGLACDACHRRGGRTTQTIQIRVRPGTAGRAYPLPTSTACHACHVDAHRGELRRSPGGGACEACHGSTAWIPAEYDVARHNRLAEFPLRGAHAATPCVTCHRDLAGDLTLKPASSCRSCHAQEDPHGGRFGDQTCDECHGTASFQLDAFDHAGLAGGCSECHAADDPHAGQFSGRECDACHSTERYAIPDFSHDATGFALDGAHERIACASCHGPQPGSGGVVQWVGVPRDCAGCHGGHP